MRCVKAKRRLALLAGGELPKNKARAVRKHLQGCAPCRREFEEYNLALGHLKTLAREEAPDWKEEEWHGLMVQAMAQKPEPRAPVFALPPRAAWTYGLLLLLVLGAGVFFLKSILTRPSPVLSSETLGLTDTGPARLISLGGRVASQQAQDLPFLVRPGQAGTALAAIAGEKPSQDVLSMTLISQGTGLRVYWTFNKSFDWEEEK